MTQGTPGTQGRADAAQELANRMRGNKITPAAGEQNPLNELEATIAKVENIQARELLQASANRLKAKMELEEKETRQRIRRIEEGRDDNRDNDGDGDREMTKASIAANALLLLEKGVPPNVVGQYLIGSQLGTIPVGVGGAQGGQQGLTMTDVKAIFEMAKGEKGTDPELKIILSKLTDKVNDIEAKVAAKELQQPPKTTWVIHPDGTKEEVQAGEPVVIKAPAANSGKSIEELKEQNRHDEKLEEIATEREYKQTVGKTLSSLPEKIGAGLANAFVEAEGPPPTPPSQTKVSESVMYFTCPTEGCGYKIPYAPTALRITCPKCKTFYDRTVEQKAPAQ